MSLRVTVADEHLSEMDRVVKGNLKAILVHSKSVGVRTVPDWQDNLTEESLYGYSDVPISKGNNLINFERLGVHRKLTETVRQAFPDYEVSPSGFFHYPPTGYMGWHTNSDVPCKRLYLTWAPCSGKSFFRYVQDGQVVTDYDDEGITLRSFDITDKPPYLWHCVGSEVDRISIGYRLNDTHNGR